LSSPCLVNSPRHSTERELSGRTTLGTQLKKMVRRRFNDAGLRLERAGDDLHAGGVLWRVEVDGPSSITWNPDATDPRTALQDRSV